jgi:PAS domain-containing protein
MPDYDWFGEFTGAITGCDLQGTILEMNEKAAEIYREYGGKELIGRNLLDCHPEAARNRLIQLMGSGERNVYTIEKNGNKKLIYQTPWIRDGRRCGMIELALEIPIELPHFVR